MDPKAASGSGRPVKGILKNRSSGGISLAGKDSGGSLQAGGAPPPLPAAAPGLCKAHAAPAAAPPHQTPLPPPPRPEGPCADDDPAAAAAAAGKKSQKWDEMNILATYHPAGKDYGLMKIDEPSTPYHSMVGEDEDAGSDTEGSEGLTADVLATKLAAAEGKGPKIFARQESSDEEEDEEELTPEELEKKRQFEMKRKMHYNEAQNIKLARQLIEKELRGDAAPEDGEEDEDEEMTDAAGSGQMSPELAPAPADSLENVAHGREEVCSGL